MLTSANASPESFRTTRFQGPVTASGIAGTLLADLDPREASDLGGAEQVVDGLLRVLHEPLLEERVVLEERAEATLDDLRDRLLGLALVAGEVLEHLALVVD